MSQLPTLHELIPLLPELVLACGAMAMLMLGVAIGERSGAVVNGFCFIVLLLAGAALSSVPPGTHAMFGGSFLVDDYARFLKLLTLVGSGGALLLSLDYLTVENQQKFEYGTLFLLSTLGMLMLISASDLIALYLGLELMSLPLYVIAASNRENVRSTEAGLKYFVLGALSSGMLLYGASLIYGFTGTINFHRHREGNAVRRQRRADLRPGVSFRRVLLQDFCGSVPYVDARCLRGCADAGHGVFRRRAEGRRHCDFCTCDRGGVSGHHA